MNIFKKTITYSALIIAVTLPIFFLTPTKHASAANCKVVSVSFHSKMTGSTMGLLYYPDPQLELYFTHTGCTGWSGTLVLENITATPDVQVGSFAFAFDASGVNRIPLVPGEYGCTNDSPNCEIKASIKTNLTGQNPVVGQTFDVQSQLIYDCKSRKACSPTSVWSLGNTANLGDIVTKPKIPGNAVPNLCKILDAEFYPNSKSLPSNFFTLNAIPTVGFLITTEHCEYQQIGLTLVSTASGFEANVPEFTNKLYVVPKTNQFIVKWKAGDTLCKYFPGTYDCTYRFSATTPLGKTTDSESNPNGNGTLEYDDDPNGNAQHPWSFDSSVTPPTPIVVTASAGCKVTSANFSPPALDPNEKYTVPTGHIPPYEHAGETFDYYPNFFADTNQPVVKINIATEGCANQPIFVSLVGGHPSDSFVGYGLTIPPLDNKKFTVPISNTLTIDLQAGETGCYQIGTPHCLYYIIAGTTPYSGTPDSSGILPLGDNLFYSKGKPKGKLAYNCSQDALVADFCLQDWIYGSDTAVPDPTTVNLESNDTSSISPDCLDKTTGKAIEGCYQLYGGLAEVLKGKFDGLNSIGDFINAIIALAIGIAGIITVGMIMFDGFTYWKAGKTGNETDLGVVKGRIWKRLLGLLLLFTIYTILRTINPDLLNLTPRINLALLDFGEQGDGGVEPTTTSDENADFSTTKPAACKEGLEKVYGFIACKTISPKLKAMVDTAKASNVVLGGGGFRTLTQQINLRKNNCGGSDDFSIYQKKAKECTPPTAIPGTSRHEQGLAFDFTCNGKGMINTTKRPSTEICFNWLKTNAAAYGLKNLPSENWHWSIDGR